MEQQDKSMFGDDINSTPIMNLQHLPAMTSKADGSNVPLEPPMYNPTIEQPQPQQLPQQQKRVRFEDDEDPPVKRRKQHPPPPPQQQQQYYMYPPPPPPVAPAVEKKKKIFELLGAYSQHITVFALILAVLWYYAKITTFPYFGNGAGYVSAFGSVALAIGASGVFGVVKHVVD